MPRPRGTERELDRPVHRLCTEEDGGLLFPILPSVSPTGCGHAHPAYGAASTSQSPSTARSSSASSSRV